MDTLLIICRVDLAATWKKPQFCFFFIEFFVVRVCVQKPRAAPLCRVIIKGDLLKRHSDASDGLGSRSKRRAVRTHLPRSLVGTHCIAL